MTEPVDDTAQTAIAAYLDSLANTTTYDELANLFRHLVNTSVAASGNDLSIRDLPVERLKERIVRGISSIRVQTTAWIVGKTKGSSVVSDVSDLLGRRETRLSILTELVRAEYSKELFTAVQHPKEFWDNLFVLIGDAVSRYGVVIPETEMRKFLLLVDEKSKKMLAVGRTFSDSHQKQERRAKKGLPPRKGESSLCKEYVRAAAASRIHETGNFARLSITIYGILSIAVPLVKPDVLLKIESELSAIAAMLKASMIMDKPTYDEFLKNYMDSSRKLLESAGTIIVHRPDDLDTGVIDGAIKDVLATSGHALEESLEKWVPEIKDARAAAASKHGK